MTEKKKIAVVVIPTYNEADNIGKMLDYLATNTFPKIKNWQMHALVVDGNSPDGTAKVAQKYVDKYPSVHLLVETSKDGIGAAYLKGFRLAKEQLKADVVCEFDSDFQHPPEAIEPLLQKIEQGYDYVCGSRKIAGGSNPKGWGFKRLFFSEAGGFTARFMMFFPTKNFFKVTDPTTGLKATRVNPYIDEKLLDFKHLYSRSFGYKLQLLFETIKSGAKYTEIPLQFGLRTQGESKIEPQTAKEIFKVALRLRLNDPGTKSFLKFGTVGTIGFLVNSLALEFFRSLPLSQTLADYMQQHPQIPLYNLFNNPNSWAGALAAEVSIVSNYLLNNFWTFRHQKHNSIFKFIGKFFQFNLTSIGAIAIQFLVIGSATHLLGDTIRIRQFALIFSIVFLILPYNWFMYNTFIWKKKK